MSDVEQDLSSVMAPEGGGFVEEDVISEPRKKRSREEKGKEKESPPKKARIEETSPLPIEDTLLRRKKIQKIRNFVETWPEILEEMVKKNDIENMTSDELDKFTDEVKLVIGTHSDTSIGDTVPEMGMALYEKVMCGLGLRVKGIHGIGRDPNFKKAFKEWVIEKDMMMYIPPEYRMGLMIIQATAMLHMENEDNPEYAQQQQQAAIRQKPKTGDNDTDLMMQMANELKAKDLQL